MRKSPIFGIFSLSILVIAAIGLFVYLMMDEMGHRDPASDSLDILIDGLDTVVYSALVTAAAVLVSTVLATLSFIRGERRVPAVISLIICLPILFYFAIAMLASFITN